MSTSNNPYSAAKYIQNLVRSGDNLTLIGNYNGENIGDNAILRTILFDLEHLELGQIFVPTRYPEKTQEIYAAGSTLKIQPISFANKLLLLKKTLASRLLFVGGGTIFSKYAGPFVYVLPAYLLFFKLLGKKIVFFSNGFDPSTPLVIKIPVFIAFLLANKVSVRDEKSRRSLRFVERFRPIDFVEDPVKHLLDYQDRVQPYVDEQIKEVKKRYKLPKSYLLTCFNPVKERRKSLQIAKQLAAEIDKSPHAHVVMLSFYISEQLEMDDQVYNELIRDLLQSKKSVTIVSQTLSPFTVIRLMQKADQVYAERLHSMVLAYLAKVSFYGYSYQRKCTAFLEQINHSEFVEVDSLIN